MKRHNCFMAQKSCNNLQLLLLASISVTSSLLIVLSGSFVAHGIAQSSTNDNSSSELVNEREFVSPQARIQMDCQRDRSVFKVNFTRPFNGILGVGSPESTKCKLIGTSERFYELNVNHNATEECSAKWDNSTSSIANTLFIRFHQSLETGADISKNVLCRLSVGDLIVGRRPTPMRNKQASKIIKAKRNP